jgi:hypothetical protein
MDAEIRVTLGAEDDLAALYVWLSNETELRGRVRTGSPPIGVQELGSLPDLLTVACGAGGAGTVLASSLKTWLQTRRTDAKITVKYGGRSVTVDLHTVEQVVPLLERLLDLDDEH